MQILRAKKTIYKVKSNADELIKSYQVFMNNSERFNWLS